MDAELTRSGRIERADAARSPGQRTASLLALWLAGMSLRVTVLAIPPVVPLLHRDLNLSETAIGWLSSLPPMLFALAAIPGALLIARIGVVPALLTGLLLNAIGSAARGLTMDASVLYLSTIVMAAGVSVMQPALPPLVRAWFPQAVGFATAVYTNGLLIGELLVVSLTIPLVLPLVADSWRLDFVAWAVPVLITIAIIALCIRTLHGINPTSAKPLRWWPNWRNPLIWRLGFMLGAVNTMYFSTSAFLPDYMIAAGRPDLVGPALTSLNITQLPASFLMLGIAGRLVTRPLAYAAMGLLCFAAAIGMMTMTGEWIVVWAGVLGFANAVILILAFALPSVLSAADDVPRVSAGMFTISYSCAMVISVLSGWLWDVTHRPIAGLAPVAACAFIVVVLASTVRHVARLSSRT